MAGHTAILNIRIMTEGSKAYEVSFSASDGVTLGRGQKADIPIRDGRLSRIHAKIGVDGPVVTIMDLGSLNGTIVNDQPIDAHTAVKINPGDTVVIGHTTIEPTLVLPSVRGSTRPVSELGNGTVVVLADSCSHPVEMDDLLDVVEPAQPSTTAPIQQVHEDETARRMATASTREVPVRGTTGIPPGMYRFCYNGAMYGPITYEQMSALKTAEWSGSFDEALLNDLPICSGR